MCGIAGQLRFDGAQVEAGVLAAMCEALRHRGPDERGWHVSGSVGLANTRLRIIDLSPRARQPLFNEDSSACVVLNGEIYNFRELRKSLESRGHRFRSGSDTEVIVHLYEEFGTDCVKELDGMFAFALWDAREKKLQLARDRTGKKPLYYYAGEQCYVFASEIKALFRAPEVPREIHTEALPAFLALGYVPCPQTLYRGIEQIEPGTHEVVHAGGRRESSRYWDFRPAEQNISQKEAKPELRERIRAAVKKRLVSDVPLGAFLSGGIDSSIVVGVMSQELSEPVKTFCIGFEGDPRFDERQYARIVAQKFGTEHREYVVGPQSVGLVETLVRHHDQPFMDSSAIPTYLVSKLAREHVTVVLNGDGGDELFAGYRRFRVALGVEKLPGWFLRALGPAARVLPIWNPRIGHMVQRIAASGKVPSPLRYWAVMPLYASELWNALRPELQVQNGNLLEHAKALAEAAQGMSPLSRLLYCNYKDYLVNDLHVKMDRCSMAHGLEARSPFLDTQLIEYVSTLPDQYKMDGGRTKVVLRDAYRDLLPQEIYRRGKMGFGVPLASWFRGNLQQFLSDTFNSPTAQVYEFLERAPVVRVVNDFQQGKQEGVDALWTLLTFEVWLQQQREIDSLPASKRHFATAH